VRKFLLGSTLSAVAAVALLAATSASATTLATISDTTGQQLGNGPFTLGWEFQANTAEIVTALGAFDDSQDGLNESHDVGLWDANGVLLASTTIASGTGAALINQFRYNSVAPVTLVAGQDYFIGAVWLDGADPMVFAATGLTTDPSITYLSSAYIAGGTLTDPTFLDGGLGGYFGPNLIGSTVPEPLSLSLFGAGLAGAAAIRRRKKSVV